MARLFSLLLLLLALLLPTEQSQAATSEWAQGENYRIRLVTGNVEKSGEQHALWMGVHIEMQDGWKVYWRTPGDGGLPIKAEWEQSTNIEAPQVFWPAPTRYVEYETIEAYAYKHAYVQPYKALIKNKADTVNVSVALNFAICKELCLFEKQNLTVAVPAGKSDADAQALIDQFLAKVPAENGTKGLKIESVSFVEGTPEKGTLKITASAENGFKTPDVYIESDSHYRFPRPQITLGADGKTVEFLSTYETNGEVAPMGKQSLTLTLVNGEQAVELQTKAEGAPIDMPAPVAAAEAPAPVPVSYLFILLMAYLGGLILNIMPCVLPVLSLKILSVMKHSASQSKKIRTSFLSSAAGIFVSFMLLAALVAALKAAGTSVGWGFQFQSPVFLTFMLLVVSLFAANLMGLYEIHLPSWLGGAALQASSGNGYWGHFATGVFATLLATPCSAPLLGTAIGFAFTQNVLDIFIVFGAMAIGLATPYLLFVFFPALVGFMPKPGAWMVKVKFVLGLLLLATALWLVFIISNQSGLNAALMIGSSVLVAVALLYGAKHVELLKKHGIGYGFMLAAIAVSFAVPTLTKVEQNHASTDVWVNFEPDSITRLVSEGKVVFVDITADWCLTCKANKLLVLNGAEVTQQLSASDVVAMQGDWTNRDEVIADFLKNNNRYGIPFNAVYGPGAPQGIVLPELLNEAAITAAMNTARGTK